MKQTSPVRWWRRRIFWLLLAFVVTAYCAVKEPVAHKVSARIALPYVNVIAASARGEPASNNTKFALQLPAREPFPIQTNEQFVAKSWFVAPPPPPTPKFASAPVIQVPSAPPLPFSYLGKIGLADGRDYYLLAKGDSQLSVVVGDTFDGQYKLEEAERDRLVIRYLPLAIRQDLSTEPR